LRYDSTKPDGTPRKLLDTSRLSALGWNANIRLNEGIASTYSWFCANTPDRELHCATHMSA
jgi:GDP-L-fucose synthase